MKRLFLILCFVTAAGCKNDNPNNGAVPAATYPPQGIYQNQVIYQTQGAYPAYGFNAGGNQYCDSYAGPTACGTANNLRCYVYGNQRWGYCAP